MELVGTGRASNVYPDHESNSGRGISSIGVGNADGEQYQKRVHKAGLGIGRKKGISGGMPAGE